MKSKYQYHFQEIKIKQSELPPYKVVLAGEGQKGLINIFLWFNHFGDFLRAQILFEGKLLEWSENEGITMGRPMVVEKIEDEQILAEGLMIIEHSICPSVEMELGHREVKPLLQRVFSTGSAKRSQRVTPPNRISRLDRPVGVDMELDFDPVEDFETNSSSHFLQKYLPKSFFGRRH